MCGNELGGLSMELSVFGERTSVLGGRQCRADPLRRRRSRNLHQKLCPARKLCPTKKFSVPHSRVVTTTTTTTTDPAHVRRAATMKLNVKNIRYLTPDDWRVLTAVPHSSTHCCSQHSGLTLT